MSWNVPSTRKRTRRFSGVRSRWMSLAPGARRAREDAIDGADRRQLGRFVELLLGRRLIGLAAPAARLTPIGPIRIAPIELNGLEQHGLGRLLRLGVERIRRVEPIERLDDLVLEGDEGLDLTAGGETEIVEREEIVGAGDRHLQHLPDLLQRHREVRARHFLGKRLHRRRADREPVQPRGGHAELDRQRAEHGVGRGEAQIEQHLTEPPVRRALMLRRRSRAVRP